MVFRFGTKAGLVTVRESGGSYSVVHQSLKGEDIQVLAQDPARPQVIYAGTYGNGMFQSENSGKEWKKLSLPESYIRAIDFSPPGDAAVVLAGTEPANLYASSDGGGSWDDLQIRRLPESKGWSLPYSPRSGALRTLVVHPAAPKTIIGGVEQGGVIKSKNWGKDWNITHNEVPKDVHFLSVDPKNHQRIFAATGDGLSFSSDGGESWKGIWEDYTRAVLVHSSDPRMVFAGPAEDVGEGGSILRSKDGGITWEAAHEGRDFPLPDMVEFFVIHPRMPERVFAVLSGGGVIQSEIENICWRDFEVPLSGVQFLEIGQV